MDLIKIENKLINLVEKSGGLAVKIDMNNKKTILKAIDYISKNLKKEDLLTGVILGASQPPEIGPFAKLDSEHFLNQLQVNVAGPHFLLSRLINIFFRQKKKGKVIGILSESIGSRDQPITKGMGTYIVAKLALKSMLSVFATEYSWLKVRTISPGFTQTKMLDVFDERHLELIKIKKNFLTPNDVAKKILKEII